MRANLQVAHIQLGSFKIMNKWIITDILRFASTEEYQADRYLYQACRSSRHLLLKCEKEISLYKFLIKKFKSIPLLTLYYKSLMPLKERCVL